MEKFKNLNRLSKVEIDIPTIIEVINKLELPVRGLRNMSRKNRRKMELLVEYHGKNIRQ
mgnify:CR=1 FL=1